MVALGIDLGTTYSLVAVARKSVDDGRPHVLRSDAGEARVPSAVFFGATQSEGAIVGFAALAAARHGPGALLTSTKRFMGRGRQAALAHLRDHARNYALHPSDDDRVVQFAVPDGAGAERACTPVEVAAYVLKDLRDRATAALGRDVDEAVITVPAYFDDAQRQATRDAGRLAGLKVLRLLAEPTAAAVAYGLDREASGRGQGTYVVFDLGGGTFDVSVLTFDRGLFRVLATAGDTALGGDDFDWPIAKRILDAAGLGAEATPAQTQAALMIARQAKEVLTERDEVDVTAALEIGGELRPIEFSLTRAAFEAIILPVVHRCAGPCERALLDAGFRPDRPEDLQRLDGVILVGGSTRVPLVRRFVREFFGREPLLDAHPDEVVAAGAALQAAQLSGADDKDMLLLDVTPLSLGVETMGGVIDKLIPRNASIPCSSTHTFTTYADQQTAMDIHVMQGEREKVEHCKSLARFKLRGIPPLGAGLARVQVTFQLDADGLLTVTAKEQATGHVQSIEVKPSYGLTDLEVEEMLIASIDNAEGDITERLLIEKRVEARRVLLSTQKAIDEDGALLLPDERVAVMHAVAALETAIAGDDRHAIQQATDALDVVTTPFAQRRMTRRIGEALENKRIDEIA
ncbi:MAG: Fe-S protein assembly chaperone HscA [Deltaproteobacteria bacterium]|nr:Fe-S protein assembly chaperone HscA [Deltaproteobacteria bacterium]